MCMRVTASSERYFCAACYSYYSVSICTDSWTDRPSDDWNFAASAVLDVFVELEFRNNVCIGGKLSFKTKNYIFVGLCMSIADILCLSINQLHIHRKRPIYAQPRLHVALVSTFQFAIDGHYVSHAVYRTTTIYNMT